MIFSQYGGEGEDVVAGAVRVRRGLGQRSLQRRGDLGALGAHGDGVRLLEDRPDQGGDPRLSGSRGTGAGFNPGR
jgi:hypothetical protein